jgi:hypothetical protein
MHVIVLFLLSVLFNSSGSLSENYTNLDVDKIVLKGFPLYQEKGSDVVFIQIVEGDRVKLIMRDNSPDQWVLVKSTDDFLGWSTMKTIMDSTRDTSLDMGDYVSEAEVDLDGDGVKESIKAVPQHWCWGCNYYVNEEYKVNSESEYFVVVDLDVRDNHKEIFVIYPWSLVSG